nr:hypothetical protein [Desulfobulbaceae bacterium]
MNLSKFIVIVLSMVFMAGESYAIVTDAPHNESNVIECNTCHSYSLWWEFSPLTRGNSQFDTQIALICATMCHNSASPQDPKDHSNTVLGTRHRPILGGWTQTCVDCHDPHFQAQLDWSSTDASDLFLATGVINAFTDLGDGTTAIGYTNLTTKSGWEIPGDWPNKTGAGRGLIVVVNDGLGDLTYEINTAVETIPGDGLINLQGTAPSSVNGLSFTIIYGQFIRSQIRRASINYPVKFFEPGVAVGGFADFSGSTYTGLCQVCHTQTAHFRFDGSSSDPNHTNINLVPGDNCLSCHAHETGFAHSGDGSGPSCAVSACHDSGSHSAHLDINIDCSNCHDLGNMYTVGGAIQLDLGSTTVCVSCHHDGAGDPPNQTDFKVRWPSGPGFLCDGCHGNPPAYANGTVKGGTPKANSHSIHLANNYGCQACHYSTTTDGLTVSGTSSHVNGSFDVNPSPSFSFTYVYNDNGGTCGSVSCHGGNAATWGASGPFSCDQCHLGDGDSNDYSYANGTLGRIDTTQWLSSGHGAPSNANYSVSNNPGAAMVCDYCHTGSHDAPGNPFRLANIAGTDGMNGVCLVCHQTGAPGFDPDGLGALAEINATTSDPVNSFHAGNLHDITLNGGKFCWDCHDPHGDSNIFMIHDSVTKQSDGLYGIPTTMVSTVFTDNATGSAYSQEMGPFTGICNVCHTIANHYGTDYGDAHRRTYVCTNCHLHDGLPVGEPPVINPAAAFEPQTLFVDYGGVLLRTDGSPPYPLINNKVTLRNQTSGLIEDSDNTDSFGVWHVMAPDDCYIVEPDQGARDQSYFYPETLVVCGSNTDIQFTPDPAPQAPVLIDEPYHSNLNDTPTVNVLLEWNAVIDPPASNPVLYYYEIATNSLFSPLVTSGFTTATNVQFVGDAGQTYLWRVAAKEDMFPGRTSSFSVYDDFLIYSVSGSGDCSHMPTNCAGPDF